MTQHCFGALLLGGVLLSATMASAETTYIVDKVTITGSTTVPTEKLYAAIQEHKGSSVTQADIVADQAAITKVLGAANVVGGIKTSMAAKSNKHIDVVFAVEDHGAQAPIVTKVAPKLHAEEFDGNKSVSSDKLMAASALNPGDDLSNEKIAAAQVAIVGAYKAAKLPINVSVSAETRVVSQGRVDVLWHVVETKGKKKRDTEDAGQKLEQ